MTFSLDDIKIPDTAMAREITELVRDTESDLLFHHSSRVYYFGDRIVSMADGRIESVEAKSVAA